MPETAIRREKPFTVQVQHDGVDTDNYELLIDGQVVTSTPAAPSGVNFPFPEGKPQGTYALAVRAVGLDGSATSDTVTLVVTPAIPTQPRIVIVIG